MFELLRMFTLFQVLKEKLNGQIAKARQDVEDRLREKHKIRSRSCYFMEERLQKELEPIEKALREEYEDSLKRELHSSLYDEYVEYRRKYDANKHKWEKRVPHLYQPARVFTSFYNVFPPYRLVETVINDRVYYSLEKFIETQVSTDHHFWKFSLYRMRLYNWSKNCFFYLVALVWVGPLGLKQLLTLGEYVRDQRLVNSTSSIIIYDQAKSLYLQFMQVMEGIKKSRAAF